MAARRLIQVCVLTAVLCIAGSSGTASALPAGPISSLNKLSSVQLKPGVTLTHYRARVAGVPRLQDIYKVSWKIGDPHISLESMPLGPYNAANQTITVDRMSSLGAPHGLLAALNGDFSVQESWSTYRNNGLLVSGRNVMTFGWGGPGVGFLPNGDFMMGKPSVRATHIMLPQGYTTVGAWDAVPGHSDQVGVYATPGATVTLPSGTSAFSVATDAFANMLRGTKSTTNRTGLGISEKALGFVFREPSASPTTIHAALAVAVPSSNQVTVPAGGALFVVRNGGAAAVGLAAIVARTTPIVSITGDAAGWANVDDVMGGKPQLVTDGNAVTTRPASVDPWQWTCGGGCWRPALVRSSGGRGWFILAGSSDGGGLTMPLFARVLKQLGARQAMGFDNNGSAELYRPPSWVRTAYGYQRDLATATGLFYR
jgi:hypothetical protein